MLGFLPGDNSAHLMTYIDIYVHMWIYMHVCAYICTHMYINMYIYMYICVHIYAHTCIHIYLCHQIGRIVTRQKAQHKLLYLVFSVQHSYLDTSTSKADYIITFLGLWIVFCWKNELHFLA